MDKEIQTSLIDLYAERELPSELEDPLEQAAGSDPALRSEMISMRQTVENLRQTGSEYNEDSHERIIEKLAESGVEISTNDSDKPNLQYSLPIYGAKNL